MLIGIIILTTGQAWAHTTGSTSGSTTTQKVFTSIKELRDAAQTNGLKHDDVVVKFDDSNPTTVVAVMKHADPDIKDDKFVNSFFIVNKGSDNNDYGLWVSPNGVYDEQLFSTWNLKIGSQITGYIIGDYRENESGMPYFGSLVNSVKIGDVTYNTSLTVNRKNEANETTEAVYPYTEVADVNTVSSSYGKYLNTIIKVPGTIKKGTNNEFYLVKNETTKTTDESNRIYFNSSQLEGINLDDYVGTSGTFEGILVKRKKVSQNSLY